MKSKSQVKKVSLKPKGYFVDTGQVCFSQMISTKETIGSHPLWGALFENAVISEILKNKLAGGVQPELYFWRSQSGVEIDLITMENGKLVPHEIKMSSIVRPQFFKNLIYWRALEKNSGAGRLITNCAKDVPMSHGIKNIYWKNL